MNLNDVVVWSDTHFSHRNVMKFCKKTRPYAVDCYNPTADEIRNMDEALIAAWNKKSKNKVIWFLGDFSFSKDAEYNASIFNRLEGDKHLIKGNHDHKETYRLGWSSVHEYKELKIGDDHFVLFHYPISSWNKMIHGSYHLHGHVHGEHVPGKDTLRLLDVAVDNGFTEPLSLQEVKDYLSKRTVQHPPIW